MIWTASKSKKDVEDFIFDANEIFKTGFKKLQIYRVKIHDYMGSTLTTLRRTV